MSGCGCGAKRRDECLAATGGIAEPEPGCPWKAGGWLVDAADLLGEPDPGPTPWLVQGLIVDRALVAAVGRWKTTKSYGLLDLCIAVATGRPAFGTLPVPTPGPVVFVNEESGRAALWRRLDALCRGRAIDPEELRGRLHVAANAGVKLDDPHWQNELVDLGELKPRLYVFDPLARMKGAGRDENAQLEMAAVIEFWRELRESVGAAVCLVHHTGHSGDHMRGSSDLESVWETRLTWKRDGQSPIVELASEHREAETTGPHSYRIAWDGPSRSMRFELEEDEATRYARTHPEASANDVYKAVGGNRRDVLAAVRRLREGGSESWNHPGTTPREGPSVGGSPDPHFPFRGSGSGTTQQAPGSENGNHPADEQLSTEAERLLAKHADLAASTQGHAA